MNIAIAIIVGLAMVARAQSLDCFKCQEVNLVSGAQNSCTSDSIGQCSGEQVCSTLTIKFIISANGKPMDNFMKQRKCLPMTAEDKELSKCGNLESQFRELYGAQGFRNYGCEIEFCEDDKCNSDSYTKTTPWSRNAGKYLGGYSAGTAKYDTLLKAQSECLERSDCGGITYETYSKKYTLRSGTDLQDSPHGEVSWMVSAWSRNADKYLGGYSKPTAKYATLLKAQTECLKRSNCGGITYETSSKLFSLRGGTDLKDSTSGEISWMLS